MKTEILGLCGAALALTLPGTAHATVTFFGDYIGVTVGNDGSLSSLKHDPTGHAAYGVNDYITPGTPHEGFSTNSTQGGFRQNGNASSDNYFGGPSLTLFGSDAMGYDFAASWTGADSLLSITNRFFYNTGDERIRILTTLTALSDITNLAFARSVDPDPDVNTSGSFDTNNQRGNALFGTDDFIGAAGPVTGLTLALVNGGNPYTSNTLIGDTCCNNINPNLVLAGGANNSSFDHSLNMAWSLGSLNAGASTTLEYFYAVGDRLENTGGPGAVPEPATWLMMLAGLGVIGGAMRRRGKQRPNVQFAF